MKQIFFCLLVLLVYFGHGQNADLSMLKSMNKGDHPQWDKAMRATSFSVYPAMFAGSAGLLITGYANHDKAMVRNSVKMAAALGLNQMITTSLKFGFKRKRPFEQYPDQIVQRTSVHGFSFPSGHTSSAFATATALTLGTKKWYVAVPAYIYACGVGYSRMRLGVHFPSDVFGGIVVGVGSSLLVWQVDKWLSRQ